MGVVQDPTHPDGVVSTTGSNGELTRARDRKANAALDLRLAGYSWEEVAEIVGYPDARAAQVNIERALEAHLKEDERSQGRMRDMAGRRLERLLRAVWHKAIDPESPEQMAAQDRARQVISQYSKLYGLDAPTEVNLHANPSEHEIDRWIAAVVSAKDNLPEEADIVDADIIEPDALEA